MTYFYLVASLPWLNLTEAPPMTAAEFRFRCQGVLSEKDLAELDHVLAGRWELTVSNFSRRWADMETQLRNAVARARAAQYSVDPREYQRPYSHFFGVVEDGVTSALAHANPLERELALDRCRWSLLGELAHEEPYGLGSVLAFALRLTLCARWSSMQEEAGRARVEELVAALGTAPQSVEA